MPPEEPGEIQVFGVWNLCLVKFFVVRVLKGDVLEAFIGLDVTVPYYLDLGLVRDCLSHVKRVGGDRRREHTLRSGCKTLRFASNVFPCP